MLEAQTILIQQFSSYIHKIRSKMRENTPPGSPFGRGPSDEPPQEQDDLNEMVYIGDIDDVIEMGLDIPSDSDDDDEKSEPPPGGDADDEGDMDEQKLPNRDDSCITFRKHDAPVFCGDLHPTEDLAVTGGEDERAFVWTTDTGEVVFEVTGHKDSVTGAEFSYDGTYVATGDMAGDLQVFRVTQEYKKVWGFQMSDMSWMRWHTAANVLFAGGETGEIYVWRIPSGDCKVLQGDGSKCEVGKLTADGKKLVAGYSNGTVKVWDIKTNKSIMEIIPEGNPMAHTSSVIDVATDRDNGLFLTASDDGNINICSNTGIVTQLHPNAGGVECVAFAKDSEIKLAASGTLEGKVHLWDVSKQTVRAECEVTHDTSGITDLLWLPEQTLLCSNLSGAVKGFDGRSGQQKFVLLGHEAEVYTMKYVESKKLLLTTSEDNTAKLFTSFLI